MARGIINKNQNLVSIRFSEGLLEMCKEHGCLNEEGDLILRNLKKCFLKQIIDVEFFN